MLKKAISKIKEEIEKTKDINTKAIGKYLLTQIETNEEAIKNIYDGKKTLKECSKKVVEVARKKAINGCAILSDEEVYKIVRDYFEIKVIQNKILQVEVEEIKEDHGIINKPNSSKESFNVSLEDFLN